MKVTQKPIIELEVVLRLSYDEAAALHCLASYGVDNFVEFFYKNMGKHYMQPHEGGLRSLLESANTDIPPIIGRFENSRSVMSGSKVAKPREE